MIWRIKNKKNLNIDIFQKYYYENNLSETSEYRHCSKEQLEIEAAYMNNCLHTILKYIEYGGKNIDFIQGEVMDGIYESRI